MDSPNSPLYLKIKSTMLTSIAEGRCHVCSTKIKLKKCSDLEQLEFLSTGLCLSCHVSIIGTLLTKYKDLK